MDIGLPKSTLTTVPQHPTSISISETFLHHSTHAGLNLISFYLYYTFLSKASKKKIKDYGHIGLLPAYLLKFCLDLLNSRSRNRPNFYGGFKSILYTKLYSLLNICYILKIQFCQGFICSGCQFLLIIYLGTNPATFLITDLKVIQN